ncbi:MAG: hypothetical protein ACRYFZ_24660 [Janthinobacterium lividum]
MKPTFYSALGILLFNSLAGMAQVQRPQNTQTYITLDVCPSPGTDFKDYFTSQSGVNVEKRLNVMETVGNTSYTFSDYKTTVHSADLTKSTTNDVFQFTDDFNTQILGTTLVWRQNSSNTYLNAEADDVNINSPYASQVTITFSREVKNLKLTFQDIDKAILSNNQGSNFTDEVDIFPTNAAGQPTAISGNFNGNDNTNVQVGFGIPTVQNGVTQYGYYGNIGTSSSNPSTNSTGSATCAYGVVTRDNKTQFVFQGIRLNGGAANNPSRAGNATVLFNNPVKTVVLTYRNLYTATNNGLRLQTIAIEDISWCKVTTLPVTLTAFDAKAAGADANLTWGTASEADNDYFSVERSFDGVSFAPIGKVVGHGTTSTFSNYTYTDAGIGNKASGVVYYRLRQVDIGGTATYSPVRTVAFEKGVAAMKLYPNPATNGDDKLTLDLLTLPQGDYQASLVNTIGSTVASYTVHGGEAQPIALPASLAPGTYVMVVQGQGMHLTQRLARQ